MNMSEIKDNPLLNYSGLPPFSQVKPEHVKSAVETAIERCKKQIIELSEKYNGGKLDMNLLYYEADKCQLLCANCHAEKHFKEI